MGTMMHIEQNSLLENSKEVGQYLVDRLKERLNGNPNVAEVRGRGAMIGIELAGEAVKHRWDYILKLIIDEHVLVSTAGADAIRVLPPLSINVKEADEIANAFGKVLSQPVSETKNKGAVEHAK
jgi:acetylornithine aminotransferase